MTILIMRILGYCIRMFIAIIISSTFSLVCNAMSRGYVKMHYDYTLLHPKIYALFRKCINAVGCTASFAWAIEITQ